MNILWLQIPGRVHVVSDSKHVTKLVKQNVLNRILSIVSALPLDFHRQPESGMRGKGRVFLPCRPGICGMAAQSGVIKGEHSRNWYSLGIEYLVTPSGAVNVFD